MKQRCITDRYGLRAKDIIDTKMVWVHEASKISIVVDWGCQYKIGKINVIIDFLSIIFVKHETIFLLCNTRTPVWDPLCYGTECHANLNQILWNL